MNDAPAQLTGLQDIFSNVISVAIGLAGIAFFIMFIVGGFNYMTAGGNPQAAEGARKTLTYAVAGLVFIALAYLILRLISQFTGVTGILKFQIYQNP
jgi:TRAP-type C4-dicarboxylate transport system permease small subunit